MGVALSKHLLNVAQGCWRQGGRGQRRGSAVAIVACDPRVAPVGAGAVGRWQDVQAGLGGAWSPQVHHRSLSRGGCDGSGFVYFSQDEQTFKFTCSSPLDWFKARSVGPGRAPPPASSPSLRFSLATI